MLFPLTGIPLLSPNESHPSSAAFQTPPPLEVLTQPSHGRVCSPRTCSSSGELTPLQREGRDRGLVTCLPCLRRGLVYLMCSLQVCRMNLQVSFSSPVILEQENNYLCWKLDQKLVSQGTEFPLTPVRSRPWREAALILSPYRTRNS